MIKLHKDGPKYSYIDAILYIEDFSSLVDYLKLNYPDLLMKEESGSFSVPPVVTGFSRTPAVVNGNSLMVYVRLHDEEAGKWRGIPHVEILSETPFVGEGTANALYDGIFNDPDKLQMYDTVYNRTPYEIEEGGEVTTITPPDRFGVIAGA